MSGVARDPVGAALEPLMSIDAVADYLGVSVPTIYDWRVSGKGPRAIRVGRHLKFAVSDVQAWVAAQREAAPGRPGPGSPARG
jgi:excisionase family DNA binding protein